MASEQEVSAVDVRRRFSELLSEVAFGNLAVTITRNGRPVARLVPVEEGAAKGGGRAKRQPSKAA